MTEKLKKKINGLVNGARVLEEKIEKFFRGKPYEPAHVSGYEYQIMDGRWMYRPTDGEKEPIWMDTMIPVNDTEMFERFKLEREKELRQEKTV